ncbi:MAG: TolC family protein [Fusobacteriota bacterium]
MKRLIGRIIKRITLFLMVVSLAFSYDLDLNKALEIGEKNNYSILKSNLELENSELDVKKAKGDRLPGISGSTGINKDGKDTARTSYSNSISIRQPIYTWGKETLEYESTKLRDDISQKRHEELLYNIRHQIKLKYINTLKGKFEKDAYKKSYEELLKQYENGKILYEKQSISRSEILKLESSLMKSKANLIKSKQEYEIALEKLKNLIGLESDEEINIITPEISIKKANSDQRDRILDENIEIQILKLNQELNYMTKDISKANLYPDISFSFSYSASDENLVDSFKDWNWRAGISISYDIYDWGSKKASYEKNQNDIKISELDEKEKEREITLEIKEKEKELEGYDLLIDSQKKSVESLEESYKIDKIKYENRYISTLDFLKNENELTSSRIELINLEMDYYITYYEYQNLIR